MADLLLILAVFTVCMLLLGAVIKRNERREARNAEIDRQEQAASGVEWKLMPKEKPGP